MLSTPEAGTLSATVGRAFFGTRSALRPAQVAAMAPILAGDDALILAGTGSGKTEAAVAPLVDRYLHNAHAASGATWVYVSPTRALANDIHERLAGPLESLQLSVGLQHGERKSLHRRACPAMVVSTPESLDILVTGGHAALRSVRGVLVDEAHQLAGSQRGLQLAIVVRRLEELQGRDVQVVGMSATVSDPAGIWEALRPGRRVEIVRDAGSRARRFRLRRETTDAETAQLLSRLVSADKVLVFARSRHKADRYASLLGDLSPFGRRVYVHHSAVDRCERERIEREFKEPDRAICFATTTLELGIDVGDVNLVVLADPATDWKSFLQRIGRGNRRSDGPVESLCLVGADSRSAVLDAALQLSLCRLVENTSVLEEPPARQFGAIAQQACQMVDRGTTWTPRGHLLHVLSSGAGVGADVVNRILDELVARDVLKTHAVLDRLGSGPELEQGSVIANLCPDFSVR